MAFIVLGSIGSALASGLAAVGLGTVGTAAAAGSGIAGAVGTAAGAASGIGSGIAGGIASGLGALGMGTAAAPSALASAIGTGATTAAGSAGLGAASSAAMGGDPGQGALFGAAGGALMSGLGALGGAAAPAGGITGQAGQAVTAAQPSVSEITKGVATPAFQQATGGIPGAAQVVAAEPSVSAITKGTAAPAFGKASQAAAASTTGGSDSMFGDMSKELGKEALKGAMSPEEEPMPRPSTGGGGRPQSRYAEEDELMSRRNSGSPFANPFRGFSDGGLTTLKGGGIAMRDGQYVIPADVVSAIGNGSSKAGAKFLEQAFTHYIQNGPPEGVKPPQRAGSLAERRAVERMQRAG